jgi:hypothetical protein
MSKPKLILLALGFFIAEHLIAGSALYQKGFHDGIASVDSEAFDAYAQLARQMKPELYRVRRKQAETTLAQATVWDAIDHKHGRK